MRIQLEKAKVGTTSGPTWRLFHSSGEIAAAHRLAVGELGHEALLLVLDERAHAQHHLVLLLGVYDPAALADDVLHLRAAAG